LGRFFGNELLLGPGLGLGFGTHDSTTPLLSVLIILVIEVSLKQEAKTRNQVNPVNIID